MLHRNHFASALCALTFACTAAHADTLQFNFTATVTAKNNTLPGVKVGTTFDGSFSYDPTDPDYINASVNYGSYGFGLGQISANILGTQVSADRLNIDVFNDLHGNVEDGITLSGGNPVSIGNATFPSGSFGFNLASLPGNTTAVTSTAVPTSYNVAAFDADSTLNYGWLQTDGGQGGTLMHFRITSISVVPEPSSFLLGFVGLVAVVRARRHLPRKG